MTGKNTLRYTRPPLRCGLRLAAAAVFGVLCLQSATAQDRAQRIWDVQLGTHVGQLPVRDFVDPACGTNGGPPGMFLESFEMFEVCPIEPSGLREIWFRYEDVLEYVARARRDETLIRQYLATQILGQPVILSLLVDPEGMVRGYRVITDPKADALLRYDAASLGVHFKTRFGMDGWDCMDLPAAQGETPIGREFVKERCVKTMDEVSYAVESRYYHKPGQGMLDPFTRQPMTNQFESSARLEVVESAAVRAK